MDQLLSILLQNRGGSPAEGSHLQNVSDEHQRTVYKALAATSTYVLASPTSSNDDPLSLLDPRTNTLAFAMILTARIKHSPSSSLLLAHALTFAQRFDPRQLVVAPQELPAVGEAIILCADAARCRRAAVRPLQLICLRLNATPVSGNTVGMSAVDLDEYAFNVIAGNVSQSGVHLTPLHVQFLKVCLLAKNYKIARTVLDVPITDFASPVAPIAAVQDFLLYHYYGGLVHIGNKRFQAAQQFFEICLNAPSTVPSAIQIESYKRLVLVSLLLKGEMTALPKSVAPIVLRSCRSQAAAYLEFASAFASLSHTRAAAKAQQFAERFHADKTLGLVQQCLADIVRRKIQQLTSTYLTLSLGDIARSVGLVDASVPIEVAEAEAEAHVLQMIESGRVLATISHADGGMVSFHDVAESFDSLATTEKLERELASAAAADLDARDLDRKISLSREYLQRITQDKSKAASSTLDDDQV
ncbi:hypothetical protein HK105_201592 [Polyrhizophydium stewartii]|uniref:COP9 signalosome complex subunit 3 n=1 Tax=Polyrhizophydium stewartii TaxID=2732419 RepID=A0ABR4NGV9_9FUNG|nr:hypothetical protein HK105_001283 [Polyrhizophydium stewartii]